MSHANGALLCRAMTVTIGLWLVPSLCGGEDAFTHLCTQKMRTIYTATMACIRANGGYVPPAWMHPELAKPIAGQGAWHGFLAPHLAKMGECTLGTYVFEKKQPENTIFHCPANPYWCGGYGPGCVGYVWNSNFGSFGRQSNAKPVTLVRFEEVADKARTILMADAGAVKGRGPYCWYHARRKSQIGYWHAGKANVLFLDGHVETLAPNEIDDRWFRIRISKGVRTCATQRTRRAGAQSP